MPEKVRFVDRRSPRLQREARRLERVTRRRRWREKFGVAVYALLVERALEKIHSGADRENALLSLTASERAAVLDELERGR